MGKLFLCLGAGPGIGLATAMRFAREGFRIALAARRQDKLAVLAAKIREESGQPVETFKIDVGDYQQIKELKESVGHVDVMHFNAAITRSMTLLEKDYEDIEKDITVGISGALYAINKIYDSS